MSQKYPIVLTSPLWDKQYWQPLEPGVRALFRWLYSHHDDAFSDELLTEQCVEHECAAIWETHPYAGLSAGEGNPIKLHFNANGDPSRGIYVFQFGAYGTTHVVAFGCLEDALEDAAETLLSVSPGSFTEPEYDPEVMARFDSGGADPDERTIARLDKLMDEAEADLTYTESGYLASSEWHFTTLPSLQALVPYCLNV